MYTLHPKPTGKELGLFTLHPKLTGKKIRDALLWWSIFINSDPYLLGSGSIVMRKGVLEILHHCNQPDE